MIDLYQDEFASPVGLIYVISDGANLRAIDFEGCETRTHRLLTRHYGLYTIHSKKNPCGAVSRLKEYFAGNLQAIDDLPCETNGTEFQRAVWSALREVPAGSTTSYGTIAARIGSPKACRAVGLANGSNPIALVVPCHRIVGSNSALTGYAGGLARKEWLLDHEEAVPANSLPDLFVNLKA